MLKNRLHRAMVAVFALAAVAFTASGVPDDKGTDAAIGWWSFVVLALLFIALIATALVQAIRGRAASRKRPHASTPPNDSSTSPPAMQTVVMQKENRHRPSAQR